MRIKQSLLMSHAPAEMHGEEVLQTRQAFVLEGYLLSCARMVEKSVDASRESGETFSGWYCLSESGSNTPISSMRNAALDFKS